MTKLLSILLACFAVLSCGGTDGASAAVEAFARAVSDSSYREAWSLVTPGSRQWYDSTAAVLHRFGWPESEQAFTALAGEITEEEFLRLTGEDIFVRMAAASEDVHDLSTSIKSVSYPDSLVAVVVVRTHEGLQEIVVRKIAEEWLIDLTGLMPPAEGGHN